MDTLKFFKEWNRMCSSSNECAKCPFNGQKCDLIRGIMEEHIAAVQDATGRVSGTVSGSFGR